MPKAKSKKQVTVRMYNVGFGDAFLVTLPTSRGDRRVLFDCGSIKKATHALRDVAGQIAKDVSDGKGKARIDVVVGTHRHKDHVAGFEADVWKNVEVGEVWMPWTEHPTDPVARRIRETQAGLAFALMQTALLPAGPFKELAANALSNEKAMATLHEGFAGRPLRRFLPVDGERTFRTDVLPDVKVHVLGPSREEDVIRDMDPPLGKSYLALAGAVDSGGPVAVPPFDVRYCVKVPAHLAPGPDDRKTIDAVGHDLPAIATVLEKAVNGTSLMIVLEVGDVCCLFPGDAQWGTWEAALADPEWKQLLKRASFVKVGHHGSHNATPKEYVTSFMPASSLAMVSTCPVANWPSIPRLPLMKALEGKAKKLARSDREARAKNDGFSVRAGMHIETSIPVG